MGLVRLAEAIPLPPRVRDRIAGRKRELDRLLADGMLTVALRKVTDAVRYEAKQVLDHRPGDALAVYPYLVDEIRKLADLVPVLRPGPEQERGPR